LNDNPSDCFSLRTGSRPALGVTREGVGFSLGTPVPPIYFVEGGGWIPHQGRNDDARDNPLDCFFRIFRPLPVGAPEFVHVGGWIPDQVWSDYAMDNPLDCCFFDLAKQIARSYRASGESCLGPRLRGDDEGGVLLSQLLLAGANDVSNSSSFFDGDCGAGALVGLAFDFEGAAVGFDD